MCRDSVKGNNDKKGIGFSKKRMPICNRLDRGSNFASIRKDADLLMVSSCVNGNKPTKIKYSTTPICERLTNNFVNGLLSRTQNQLNIRTKHNNWCLMQKRYEDI